MVGQVSEKGSFLAITPMLIASAGLTDSLVAGRAHMLFNSYAFVLVFFPITLVGYVLLGRRGHGTWSLNWIIAASIVFYGIWNPINLLIITPSVLVNYGLARAIQKRVRAHRATSRALLLAGIVGNVAFLSYFKYWNFFLGVGNDLFTAGYVMTEIVLPLGISFITFQKIAFLIDVFYERTTSFTFREYLLFVLFFPQLIAGPIVHYREVMPQFAKSDGRSSPRTWRWGQACSSLAYSKRLSSPMASPPTCRPSTHLRPTARRFPQCTHGSRPSDSSCRCTSIFPATPIWRLVSRGSLAFAFR